MTDSSTCGFVFLQSSVLRLGRFIVVNRHSFGRGGNVAQQESRFLSYGVVGRTARTHCGRDERREMRCIAPSAELRYPMAPCFARAAERVWTPPRIKRSPWRFRKGIVHWWATLLRPRRHQLLRGGRPRKVLRLTWRHSLNMSNRSPRPLSRSI